MVLLLLLVKNAAPVGLGMASPLFEDEVCEKWRQFLSIQIALATRVSH